MSGFCDQYYRFFADNAQDFLFIIDTSMRVSFVNRFGAGHLGLDPQDIIGRPLREFFPPDLYSSMERNISSVIASGSPASFEDMMQFPGHTMWQDTKLVPLRDDSGTIFAVFGISRDITERKHIEKEKEYAQQFLRSIIDGVSEQVMVIGTDYRVYLMNRRAQNELVESNYCYAISHRRDTPCGDEQLCCLREVVKIKKPVIVTHRHYRKDGTEVLEEIYAAPILDESGDVIYVVEALRDITERVILEEQQKRINERLFLEQKEQTVVNLAGGIAHEFNNSLMGVLGNAELLLLTIPKTSQEYALADSIVRAADRMAELTRQIEAYARRGTYQRREFSVNTIINEALLLMQYKRSSRIEVILDLFRDIWPVYADPMQMVQVFVNLLMNAFEAMEEKGGTVTIHTENQPGRSAWECPLSLHHCPAGDYVSIRVSDTGPGIPTELLSRIFEPFFTTKFIGRGLGLSAASGIIQRHQGCITVESEVGYGATFHILIPRASEQTAGTDVFQEQKNGRKILIVEDNIPESVLLDTMLRSMGYTVVTAPHSMKAKEIFDRHAEDIALAILDAVGTNADGMKLCTELKSAKPALKLLLSGGFDEKTASEQVSACGADGYIRKPFYRSELEKMVRHLVP